jgi:hypothetical protein
MTAITSVISVSCKEARGTTINGDVHIHIGRHSRFETRQLGRHVIDGLDDVCVRLAEKDDQHRRLSVGHAEIAQVLNGVLNFGHIREAYRCTIAISDHERQVIRRHVRLVVGIDLIAPVTVVDGALRAVGVR